MKNEQPEEPTEITVIDKRGQEPQTLQHVGEDNSPGALLRLAIVRDLPTEKIEKLLELQERWERNEARKAYVMAMSEFKSTDCPIIVKDKRVSFRNSKNQLVEYSHSSLAEVVAKCTEGLARHGFHHEWETDQTNGIAVTCVVTHRLGHSTSKTLAAAPDNSGSKNQIQAIASTVTYLERYTLLQALGLAPAEDDDGRRSEPPAQPQGREAPPVDRDPEPNKRALDAIKAYAKYLGQANARTDLEKFLGRPAGRWQPEDYARIKQVWEDTVKPIKDAGPEEKKEALLRALRDEPDFGTDEHEPHEDEHPHGDPQ